ncbi:hypothetical protein RUND412_000036 [Rhizina undulata]
MLESVVEALDSSDRSTKLDTYITFCNTPKAYSDIPAILAMKEKLPLLCRFIRRDLNAILQDGENTDSQLIQQAIKLLTILVSTPQLVETMDDQNATFFLMQAIQKVEEGNTPKLIVNHYLHFIAQQKYHPRIMTVERCNRIISALETIEERVTGKSIIKARIDIYYKLLLQSRPVILARISNWIENLLAGLLNSVTEVRTHALMCATEAAKILGMEKNVSCALTDIFKREVNGKCMFDLIKERLDIFINERDGNRWEFFDSWLRIIEKCFNVSDKAVNMEAQVAWSKLIYSMNIGPHTSRKLLELLCKPLEKYLDPTNATFNMKIPRKAAMTNVSVMLYYGFRPHTPAKQLSKIWDIAVVGSVEKLVLAVTSSKEEIPWACSVLAALFDDSTQKNWDEVRVLSGPAMQPDDIPRLNPKWVRGNCGLVLKTVKIVLQKVSWHGAEVLVEAQVLWKKFMKMLADAGSKEIRPSADLMDSVAHLANFFQQIWSAGPNYFSTIDTYPISFIGRFNSMIMTTMESLGSLCFTEKKFYFVDNKLVSASVPIHKNPSNGAGPALCFALLHIFNLFLQAPEDVPVDEEHFECAKHNLAKCCTSQDSRRKKISLLAQCAAILAPRHAQALDLGLWCIIAESIAKYLPVSSIEKNLPSSLLNGDEFRDVVKVLEWTYRYEMPAWEQLFNELASTAQNEQGEAFVAVSIIEPLAGVLQHPKPGWDIIRLRRVRCLVDKANYTKPRNTINNILRTPFPGSSQKHNAANLYDKLYSLVNFFLSSSYKSAEVKEVLEDSINLLISAGELVDRCPSILLPTTLNHLQEGIGLWAKDLKLVIKTKDVNATKIITFWLKFVDALQRLPRHDSLMLSRLEILIASGLRSHHKAIFDATIKLWNSTFGRQTELEYPGILLKCLRTLRPVADLSLPTFPEDTSDESLKIPPPLPESQDIIEVIAREKETLSGQTPPQSATPNVLAESSISPGRQHYNSGAARNVKSQTPTRNFSPPRTRSAAKRQLVTDLPSASKSQKRKNSDADEEVTQVKNIRVEVTTSLTLNRRSSNPSPKKRLRSFEPSLLCDNGPSDVSSMQEIQLSAPISEQKVFNAAGPSPTYQTEDNLISLEAKAIHDKISRAQGIFEAESGNIVAIPAKLGQERPEQKFGMPRRKSQRTQKAHETDADHQSPEAESQESEMLGAGQAEVKVIKASMTEELTLHEHAAKKSQTCKKLLQDLQRTLEHLNEMDLDASQCREAENVVFEAFSKLRQRTQALHKP